MLFNSMLYSALQQLEGLPIKLYRGSLLLFLALRRHSASSYPCSISIRVLMVKTNAVATCALAPTVSHKYSTGAFLHPLATLKS